MTYWLSPVHSVFQFLKLKKGDIIAFSIMLVNRVELQMKPKTHRMPYYYELISKVKLRNSFVQTCSDMY